MLIEKLWLAISKQKWPNLVIGSDDYNMRRKAFFMGCLTVVGIICKVPDRLLPTIIPKISTELRTELNRGESNIIDDHAKLN